MGVGMMRLLLHQWYPQQKGREVYTLIPQTDLTNATQDRITIPSFRPMELNQKAKQTNYWSIRYNSSLFLLLHVGHFGFLVSWSSNNLHHQEYILDTAFLWVWIYIYSTRLDQLTKCWVFRTGNWLMKGTYERSQYKSQVDSEKQDLSQPSRPAHSTSFLHFPAKTEDFSDPMD